MRMKIKLNFSARLGLFVVTTFIAVAAEAQNTLQFVSIQCSGNTAAQDNASLILSRAANATTFKLPTGKFRVNPVSIKNKSNFKIVGTQPSGALSRGTRLVFAGDSGMIFVDGGAITLDSLEIEAPANSEAVKIAGSGSLQTPSLLVTSNSSSTSESCLSPVDPWLSAVLLLAM